MSEYGSPTAASAASHFSPCHFQKRLDPDKTPWQLDNVGLHTDLGLGEHIPTPSFLLRLHQETERFMTYLAVKREGRGTVLELGYLIWCTCGIQW
ncbi:Hypothetical predicted protein [Pelobates cultripes]|uniref:Uncharacterized protein n=1 Tax=Pelobates cultripes TaxID=61616 RepID=A0AAD1S6M5_PELCU|nr:Hypothetical predicted protein [Pelobates cultripes]